MKLHRLLTAVLIALAAITSIRVSNAASVTPYTEEFTTDAAQWTDGVPTGFATWVASNGPNGASDSYIAAPAKSTGLAANSSLILFRGNSTASPENHASGDRFAGSWIDGGINNFSAWVFNGSPFATTYFARFTGPGGGPGVAATNDTLVQPSTWTQIEFLISPSQINSTIFVEGPPSLYNTVFGNLGRVQIGVNVSAALAAAGGGTYTYGIDKISVGVPEPSSLLLGLGAAMYGFAGRRRRTA